MPRKARRVTRVRRVRAAKVAKRTRRRTLRRQIATANSTRRRRVADPKGIIRFKCEFEFAMSNMHLDGIPHVNSTVAAINVLEILRNNTMFMDYMQRYEQFSVLRVRAFNRYSATAGLQFGPWTQGAESNTASTNGIVGTVASPYDYNHVRVRSRIDPDGPYQFLMQLQRSPSAYMYLYNDNAPEPERNKPLGVCSWVNLVSMEPAEISAWSRVNRAPADQEFWANAVRIARQKRMKGNPLWIITSPASRRKRTVERTGAVQTFPAFDAGGDRVTPTTPQRCVDAYAIDPRQINTSYCQVPLRETGANLSQRRNYNSYAYSYPRSASQWRNATVDTFVDYNNETDTNLQNSQVTESTMRRICTIEDMDPNIMNINMYKVMARSYTGDLPDSTILAEGDMYRKYLQSTAPYPWLYYQFSLPVTDQEGNSIESATYGARIPPEYNIMLNVHCTLYVTVAFRGIEVNNSSNVRARVFKTSGGSDTLLERYSQLQYNSQGNIANSDFIQYVLQCTYVSRTLSSDDGPRDTAIIPAPPPDVKRRVHHRVKMEMDVKDENLNLVAQTLLSDPDHKLLQQSWRQFL